MPNIHKCITKLLEEIKTLNKKESEEKMTEILISFLLQNKYGIPLLEAFENSIYNPSKRENQKKEKEILKQKKRIKSQKYALLLRYKSTISDLAKAGNGSRKIAKYLNSHKFVNTTVSHTLIIDFMNEEGLKCEAV